MALEKALIPISLAGGIDTKTDEFQIIPGKLTLLENAKFQTAKKLRKVPGDSPLSKSILGSTQKIGNAVQLSSFQQELVLNSGTNLYSYSADETAWSDKGLTFNVSLDTSPVIRDNYAQTSQDSATHSTGVQVFAWEDSQGGVRYSIVDNNTKLQIVSNQPLLSSGVMPRCVAIGNFLLIFVYDTVAGGLFYYPITIINPTIIGTRVDVAADIDATNHNFDVDVIGQRVFVTYNSNASSIRLFYLDQFLHFVNLRTVAGESASVTISGFGDAANNFWVTYYNGSAVKYFIYSYNLPASPLLSPTIVETVANVRNVTGAAQGTVAPVVFTAVFGSGSSTLLVGSTAGLVVGQVIEDNTIGGNLSANTTITNITGLTVTISSPTLGASASSPGDTLHVVTRATIFYEISAAITYNYLIRSNTATITGTIGSPHVDIRSVGLASKAFVYGTNTFVMAAYQGPLQPTYFLINQSGIVALKLAPLNGGGLTAKSVLPQINPISPGQYQISYLQQDFFATISGTNFFQTGVMQGNINLNPSNLQAVSIGNGLQMTGGFLAMYDGISAVELGYHVFPEQPTITTSGTGGGLSPGQYQWTTVYAWTDNFGQIHRSAPSIPVTETMSGGTPVTFTSVFATGDTVLTVSSVTGLFVGQVVTDNTTSGNILAGTLITAISGSTITISNPAVAASAGGGDTLQTIDTYSASVVAVTLRITAKKPPIRSNAWIELYRTEANQTIFYLVSSITNPTYNDTTVDTKTFTDTLSDQSALGNLQLYTTGGVIENIAPPAPKLIWQYKNRLILVPFENDNTWWYSQEIIPNTPLEFNDSFVNNMDQRDGPITAGIQMDDKNIFFKGPANIFYVAGDGPGQDGSNNDFTQPQRIATGSGCINPNSVLLMPSGVFYQSYKGIYLLDRGLNSQYIGAEVEAFNSSNIVSAQVIENDNELRFLLDTGTELMFDYTFQQWTTIPNVSGVASALFENEFCYVQSDGLVLQEDPTIWTHNGNPRRIKLITSWLSMAALQGFQRVYRMLMLANFYSPHLLKYNLAINFNPNHVQEGYIDPSKTIDVGVFGGPPANNFFSVFSSGVSVINVSNAMGLAVGQTIQDNTTSGNLLPGTTITSITGTAITLSNPTLGASIGNPGDALQSSIAFGNPAGIPFGGRAPAYQDRIRMKYQKCETIQLTLEEVQLLPYGEGLSLSAISLEVGRKEGAMRLPASQSVG